MKTNSNAKYGEQKEKENAKTSHKDNSRFSRGKKPFTQGQKKPKITDAEALEILGMRKGNNGRSAGNNPAWWTKYPQLSKDALNFVFNTIAGTKLDTGIDNSQLWSGTNPMRWPVVGAGIGFLRTIGKAEEATDAFNYQMRALWLDMHRKYRGIGTYQSADLGMAIFAIICAISDLARAERVYGICANYNARNRSYPNAMLKAMGVDPATISGNRIADFRFQLNRLITKAQTLCLPKGISALDCYVGLLGNIFKDSDNIRGQWFLYDDPLRVQFAAVDLTTGSSCRYVDRTKSGNDSRQTLEDIISDLEADFDLLLEDDDIARMCSDILACYGDAGVTTLQTIPEDFTIEPVKDETRLLELHNTTLSYGFMGTNIPNDIASQLTLTGTGSYTIYQKNNIIHQNLAPGTYGATAAYVDVDGSKWYTEEDVSPKSTYYGKPMADTWHDDPSDDEKIDLLQQLQYKRYTKVASSPDKYAPYFDGYGIYLIYAMEFWCNENEGTVLISLRGDTLDPNNMYQHHIALICSALSSFDWHPRLFVLNQSYEYVGMIWDMDNYTLVPTDALKRIHEISTLSAFKLDASIIRD